MSHRLPEAVSSLLQLSLPSSVASPGGCVQSALQLSLAVTSSSAETALTVADNLELSLRIVLLPQSKHSESTDAFCINCKHLKTRLEKPKGL